LPLFRGVAADFSQVFGNILRNAAEAMKGQAVRKLWLQSCCDASWIRVSIADNGPGIAGVLQEEIFRPFFSTKAGEPGLVGGMGMGIGLYHCRELISHYGGRIEVRSSPGNGATFTIRLPRTECEPRIEKDPHIH
jgi:signal transduction histidine kinase